jgi:hypothetical protein
MARASLPLLDVLDEPGKAAARAVLPQLPAAPDRSPHRSIRTADSAAWADRTDAWAASNHDKPAPTSRREPGLSSLEPVRPVVVDRLSSPWTVEEPLARSQEAAELLSHTREMEAHVGRLEELQRRIDSRGRRRSNTSQREGLLSPRTRARQVSINVAATEALEIIRQGLEQEHGSSQRPRTRQAEEAMAARVSALTKAMLRLIDAETAQFDQASTLPERKATAADTQVGLDGLRSELKRLLARPFVRLNVHGERETAGSDTGERDAPSAAPLASSGSDSSRGRGKEEESKQQQAGRRAEAWSDEAAVPSLLPRVNPTAQRPTGGSATKDVLTGGERDSRRVVLLHDESFDSDEGSGVRPMTMGVEPSASGQRLRRGRGRRPRRSEGDGRYDDDDEEEEGHSHQPERHRRKRSHLPGLAGRVAVGESDDVRRRAEARARERRREESVIRKGRKLAARHFTGGSVQQERELMKALRGREVRRRRAKQTAALRRKVEAELALMQSKRQALKDLEEKQHRLQDAMASLKREEFAARSRKRSRLKQRQPQTAPALTREEKRALVKAKRRLQQQLDSISPSGPLSGVKKQLEEEFESLQPDGAMARPRSIPVESSSPSIARRTLRVLSKDAAPHLTPIAPTHPLVSASPRHPQARSAVRPEAPVFTPIRPHPHAEESSALHRSRRPLRATRQRSPPPPVHELTEPVEPAIAEELMAANNRWSPDKSSPPLPTLLHPPDNAVVVLREGMQGFSMQHVPSICLTQENMADFLDTTAAELEDRQQALATQRDELRAALELVSVTEARAVQVEQFVHQGMQRLEESIGRAHQFRNAMSSPRRPGGSSHVASPNTTRRAPVESAQEDVMVVDEVASSRHSSSGGEGRRKLSSVDEPVHQYSSVLDNLELLRAEEEAEARVRAYRSRSHSVESGSMTRSRRTSDRPLSVQAPTDSIHPLDVDAAPIAELGTPRSRKSSHRGALPGRGIPRDLLEGGLERYSNDSDVRLEDLNTDDEGKE